MMSPKIVKKKSKFLSLVLRHKPEILDLNMDNNGWVSVDELIKKSNDNGNTLDFETLQLIVDNNDKKRFAFSEDFSKIRANQGHSIDIDLGYQPMQPPEFLYHGTATRFIDSIMAQGLQKQNRHHVHLSPNLDTAINVGSRHGKPVVLKVKSLEMHKAGHKFYLSKNGVWLVDTVPTSFLLAE